MNQNDKDQKTKAPAKASQKADAKKAVVASMQPAESNKVSSPVAGTVPAPSVVLNQSGVDSTLQATNDEVFLTDAEGRRYCRSTDCDQIGLVDGYCRYHYLYYWKKIQVRKKILADGKLERYIDELTARYTDKFIELLRKDLRTEKDFMAAVQELELDDSANSNAQDEDEAKTYIEEISGVATDTSGRDDDGGY
ncbi:MAG: hypothetical protein ABL927_09555 [Bdellovibrionales bacterium]